MITPPMNRETGRFVDSAVIPQATLLESIPDGLLVIDDSGTIRLANPSVEFSFKYKEGELIGLSISDVLPAEAV